jgi:hypothetical protein
LTHKTTFDSKIPISDSENSSSIPYDEYLEEDLAQLYEFKESDAVAAENFNDGNESDEDIKVLALPEQDKKDKKRGRRINWCNIATMSKNTLPDTCW